MTVEEYERIFEELDLTQEQRAMICEAMEDLMTVSQRHEHVLEQKHDPAAEKYSRYYGGKTQGLNLAYKFFAHTLQYTDEVEQ